MIEEDVKFIIAIITLGITYSLLGGFTRRGVIPVSCMLIGFFLIWTIPPLLFIIWPALILYLAKYWY